MHPTHKSAYPELGTPANILRNAARYLQRNGWNQGNAYCYAPDVYPHGWPRADAAGAIGIVVHGYALQNPYDPAQGRWSVFALARNTLWDYLDVADDFYHDHPDAELGEWNDQPDMTAERVIAALNAAADRWEDLSGGAA